VTGKDYYVVLGVSRSESPAGIRNAFRELARRYHPDRGGPNATRFFQDIVEAYHVLADPRQRGSYDRGLQHAEMVDLAPTPIASPAPPPAEPLLPQPVGLLRDFEVVAPSWEELRDHLRRNFTAAWLPKSRHLEALTLEITLSPEEAARGGMVVVGVPVFYPCGSCHGAGREWAYTCATCGGEGMLEEEQPVRVLIPPGTRDGTTFDVPLRGLGIHNLFVRLLLRIAW
jgi:molecular chaperone DnaJ